jgi:hypothetical protein
MAVTLYELECTYVQHYFVYVLLSADQATLTFQEKCAQMIWKRYHVIFVRLVAEVVYRVVCSASSRLHCQR